MKNVSKMKNNQNFKNDIESEKWDKDFWKMADETKRRLFNAIRNFFKEETIIDVSSGFDFAQKYRDQQVEKGRKLILNEWEEIKIEYKDKRAYNEKRLSGYVYESLFYLCIHGGLTASFLEKSFYWMKTEELQKKLKPPSHFEAVPFYDIIPPIAYKSVDSDRSNVPQLKGDFLVFYNEGMAGERKAFPIHIVDVKKSESAYDKKKGRMLALACLRNGLIAEIAYPKKEYNKIQSLKDWDIKPICPFCGRLAKMDDEKCPSCEKIMYPFTREDWV